MSEAAAKRDERDDAPRVPIGEWGRRLGDALREAIGAGDFARARGLALDGDGQARNLAGEFAFMARGLGITLRVMLGALLDTVESEGCDRARAAGAAALVRRSCEDLAQAPAPDDRLELQVEAAVRALDARERRFAAEQAALADAVVAALDAGDAARALALLDAKERDSYLPLHDRWVRFMAEVFGWVLVALGPQALLRYHLATAEGQRAGFDKWERMTAPGFAWTSAFLLKQHMGQVTVSEDDERFTIEQAPCGSGGRLRLAGAYDGTGALPFVEESGPLTFGEARLPVYCSHCPVWNGVATLRWYGRAHWVFENAARADGGCTLHVYKNHDATPPAYAARLGAA